MSAQMLNMKLLHRHVLMDASISGNVFRMTVDEQLKRQRDEWQSGNITESQAWRKLKKMWQGGETPIFKKKIFLLKEKSDNMYKKSQLGIIILLVTLLVTLVMVMITIDRAPKLDEFCKNRGGINVLLHVWWRTRLDASL